MKPKKPPIFVSLSPNVEPDDQILASQVFWGLKRANSSDLDALETVFKRFLSVKHSLLFNSGRGAFIAILKALEFQPKSEILIQGFTCNALVNPIIWQGLKPVYVDIEEQTLNLNPADLENKITSKSKAVIIQHTFGLPSQIEEIQRICQKHNLVLIEDCAHALGACFKGQKIGAFGHASFFSFGRDKIISSVYGGAAVSANEKTAEKIRKIHNAVGLPSRWWIKQQLVHPFVTQKIIKPLYCYEDLGRYLLGGLQKAGVLSKAVAKKEKKGKMPSYLLKKMPPQLALLALNQFDKIEKIIAHQKKIADFYQRNLSEMPFALPLAQEGRVYLRYPLILKKGTSDWLINQARKENIFLNDGWRKTAVVPPDTSQSKAAYSKGMAPIAEKVAQKIVNLPTHLNITLESAQRITDFLKSKF